MNIQTTKKGRMYTVKATQGEFTFIATSVIKTIAFKVKDDGWVLVGVPCYKRIDYRKVAAVLGINRRQLRSLSPQEVRDELGFEVGGVGPVPTQSSVRVIFDRNLMDAGTIYCGSGKNTRTLEIDFADLLRVTGGLIHPITR